MRKTRLNMMMKSFSVLAAMLTSCGSSPSVTTDKMTLTKVAGTDYKILQLTDIQIIDPNQQPYPGRLTDAAAEMWADRDECAFNMVRKIVKDTNPDYIVLTGDNVYGQFDDDGSNFMALVSLMESFQKPWSLVYGNHDGETFVYDSAGKVHVAGKGAEWQDEYLLKNTKYLRFEAGDEAMGYGNYTVKLTQNNQTLMSFSFLDTHGVEGYERAEINDDQIAWYEKEIKAINEAAGKTVPNLSFMHIPFTAFKEAMDEHGGENGVGVISEDGTVDEEGNYGVNYEKFTPFYNDTAYWNKVKELGATKGIFVGHAHINNSSIMYQGVRLTFGTKLGIYDYHRDNQQGGTLITISDDASFTVRPILY